MQSIKKFFDKNIIKNKLRAAREQKEKTKKMAKPSSLYEPTLLLPIIDANPERKNRPTSSNNSAPLNEPIVT